jgi:hypothetical protein
MVVLAHGFGGVSPLLDGLIALGPVARQYIVVGST